MPFDISQAKPPKFDRGRNSGIATRYKGIAFRSQLEARWAALFDLLQWPWSYEPEVLVGYIPDFYVHFPVRDLLVEVKPAKEVYGLQNAGRKVAYSGWKDDFLVVGGKLFEPGPGYSFGWLSPWDRESNDGWQPGDHAIAHRCGSCRRISAHHWSGGWSCLACGALDGNRYLEPVNQKHLLAMWLEAGNRVQWNGEEVIRKTGESDGEIQF